MNLYTDEALNKTILWGGYAGPAKIAQLLLDASKCPTMRQCIDTDARNYGNRTGGRPSSNVAECARFAPRFASETAKRLYAHHVAFDDCRHCEHEADTHLEDAQARFEFDH